MPRKAKIDGLTELVGLWDEVFTGLDRPRTVRKGERVALPVPIAAILVKSGSCRNV